jgi:phosphate uptake regulator
MTTPVREGALNEVPPELIERLWSDPRARSRNANYARFRDDHGYRRAVKHVRSLLSFRRDLERFKDQSTISVRRLASGRGAQVTIKVPDLHFRRSLFISNHELELLRRDPHWQEADPRIE